MSLSARSDDFDPRIAAWLETDPHRAPEALLDGVLSAFPDIQQRRRGMTTSWSPRRRAVIDRVAWAAASVAVVAAALAVSRPWPASVGGSDQPVTAPGPSQVQQRWITNDDVAVTITRDPSDQADHYWRVATYDVIGLRGWSVGPSTKTALPANAGLADKVADDVSASGQSQVTVSVEPGSFSSSLVLSPGVRRASINR